MADINFLFSALRWGVDVAWKPALVMVGFFGLIILLVGAWVVWDAITWRRKTRVIRRRLEEKDLTVYRLDRRAGK